ncbi:MAG: ABC transporter permease [Candidatus Rokubacteria bacterium]|nr:ABC transporter permease [Candidatus Rokubacteria bacterium]
MAIYLLKRVLDALFVVVAVSLVVFFLLHLTGDPVRLMLPPEAPVEEVEALRRVLGLDAPLPVQYARFLAGVFQGDFGRSLRYNAPSLPLVLERVPATLLLATVATALAVLVSVPLGITAAVHRNSAIDRLCTWLGAFGQAMPVFWLAIVLILVFSVRYRLLPSFGSGSARHLVLPAATLALYSLARVSRLTRSTMLEVLDADYARTARAKGLSGAAVILKHGLRNASLPIVTVIAVEFGVLLGGAVITETVFAWPGVGRLAVQAILTRDLPLVQAIVFVVATALVFLNLAVDLLYGVLDPRIRYR